MASAAGISPSQPQAQDVEPRTKGSVMASTLIGAHAFEHLYAHSIPCWPRLSPSTWALAPCKWD